MFPSVGHQPRSRKDNSLSAIAAGVETRIDARRIVGILCEINTDTVDGVIGQHSSGKGQDSLFVNPCAFRPFYRQGAGGAAWPHGKIVSLVKFDKSLCYQNFKWVCIVNYKFIVDRISSQLVQ